MTTHLASAAVRRWAALSCAAIAALLLAALRAAAGPAGWVDPQILNSEPPVLLKYMAIEKSKIPQGIGLWKDVLETDKDLNVRFQDGNYRVITFANAILRDPRAKPEDLQTALDAKLETLVRLWVYFGSKNLDEPQFAFDQHPGTEFYAELKKSDRPFLVRAATIQALCVESIALRNTLMRSTNMFTDPELAQGIAKQLAECQRLAKEAGDMSEDQFRLMQGVMQQLEFFAVRFESRGRTQWLDQVVDIYRTLRDEGATSESFRVRKLAEDPKLAARLRGLTLPGHRLELSGVTRGGDAFDLAKLRGKVVLVYVFRDDDQAAARLRMFSDIYERLRSNGVELVGVFQGQEASALDELLRQADVRWPVLFDAERAAAKQPQPFEEKYALLWLPLNMVVAADGTVVTLSAEGERLEKLLESALAARAP